jgi:uncharacterized protein (DUF983 family)
MSQKYKLVRNFDLSDKALFCNFAVELQLVLFVFPDCINSESKFNIIKEMFNKGNKSYSIFNGSCPKCQSEGMYLNDNPYVLSQTMKMHENCSHCGFKYKVEPNFFFGAMYVSYGISVMGGLGIFLFTHYVLQTTLRVSFIGIFAGLIILMPIITRLSRNIYINLFVNYDSGAQSRYKG